MVKANNIKLLTWCDPFKFKRIFKLHDWFKSYKLDCPTSSFFCCLEKSLFLVKILFEHRRPHLPAAAVVLYVGVAGQAGVLLGTGNALYCTALHCTTLHCTLLHFTTVHCAQCTVLQVQLQPGTPYSLPASHRRTAGHSRSCPRISAGPAGKEECIYSSSTLHRYFQASTYWNDSWKKSSN